MSAGQSCPTVVVKAPKTAVNGRAERASAAGTTLGRYLVLGELGSGGMGRVLRAYDPKLRREVALKELAPSSRAGDSDGTSVARLAAEARAMAKLSHPNVVEVYDVALVPSGKVVLVMEHVRGQTLKQWLTVRARSWEEVVARFVAAGRGLASAHGAGLLHRDFKPANVLVGDRDQTKVTDFGLAKSLAPPSTSSEFSGRTEDPASRGWAPKGDLTEAGMLVGTPRYMAPEQDPSARDEELTPAADQYAFCIALWEALHGQPPFVGPDLSTQKLRGPPAWTNMAVAREVADAVRRGLAPDPAARWPSMDELLETLTSDPSRPQNRWLVGLTAVAAAAVGATSLASWADARAQRCAGADEQLAAVWDAARRDEIEAAFVAVGPTYAPAAWERAAQRLDRYGQDWISMYTETCEATAVHGEQPESVMDLRIACLHRARVQLGAVVDVLAAADAEVVPKTHKVLDELRPLRRCADAQALQADVEPPDPEEREAVLDAQSRLAQARAAERVGRYPSARASLEAANRALVGVEYGPVQTEIATIEGLLSDSEADYEAAHVALARALGLAARWRQRDQMAEIATHLLAVVGFKQRRFEESSPYATLARGLARDPLSEAFARSNLGVVLSAHGRYDESEAEHRGALALREIALGPEHATVGTSRNNLATVLWKQGKYEEAMAEHRRALAIRERALGPEHPSVAQSRDNLAIVLLELGRYAEAEVEHRRALALRQEALGPDHPDVAKSHGNLAMVLMRQSKEGEADTHLRRALEIREKVLGPEHPDVALSVYNLAVHLSGRGKPSEAEAEAGHRRALALWERTLGPKHPNLAFARNGLAMSLVEQGKYEEAEIHHRRAFMLQHEVLGSDHPDVAWTRNNLGLVLTLQGKHEQAQAEYRAAIALREKALGSGHLDVAKSRHDLAVVLAAQGNYEEAEVEHRRALAIRHKGFPPDHPHLAESRINLAAVLLARGKTEEAAQLAELAWARLQDDTLPEARAESALILARVLAKTANENGRRRAVRLAQRALQEYRRAGTGHDESVAETKALLAALQRP